MQAESYVYLLANKHSNVLYEHKNKLIKGFTQKYNVDRLLYYEACPDIMVAITREKKNEPINTMNPDGQDLYESLL